jgi:septum site-determining protein MinC
MTAASSQALAQERGPAPFQFRGGAYTVMILRLIEPDHPNFYSLLRDTVSQAPNFFRNAPVIVDLQDLAAAPPFNVAELRRRLRQHELIPIGVVNGTEEQNRAAINAGMGVLPEGRESALKPQASPAPKRAERVVAEAPRGERDQVAPAPAGASGTLLITRPVRSGQQLYAHGGDLVVLAAISAGAELLADGHIHVYGALRGRALAGVGGNAGARIFCHSLEAELISIAGFWRVREDIPERLIGKPVQIYLEDERMTIEPLG